MHGLSHRPYRPGCPDIWSSMNLDGSVMVFWLRLTFKSIDLSETDCLPYSGWAASNHLRAWIEKMASPPMSRSERELVLLDWSWHGAWVFSSFFRLRLGVETSDVPPTSWAYWPFGLELNPWFSWFSGLWAQTRTTPSALQDLQLDDSPQVLWLVSLCNCVSRLLGIGLFPVYRGVCLSLHILFVLFLWRTLTNTVKLSSFDSEI